VKFIGVDELHAAFLNECRTLGRILGLRTGNPGSAVEGTGGAFAHRWLTCKTGSPEAQGCHVHAPQEISTIRTLRHFTSGVYKVMAPGAAFLKKSRTSLNMEVKCSTAALTCRPHNTPCFKVCQ
jgi:hypothetical protein